MRSKIGLLTLNVPSRDIIKEKYYNFYYHQVIK